MSVPSPTSPLSFSTSSDGSVDHQDDVSSPSHPPQPEISPVLDGSRPYHYRQSLNNQSSSYSDILKLKVGGHSCPQMSDVESELCSQLSRRQPPRNVPLGQLSTSTTPIINHTSTQDIPPRPLVYPLRSLLHVASLAVSGVKPFLFLP